MPAGLRLPLEVSSGANGVDAPSAPKTHVAGNLRDKSLKESLPAANSESPQAILVFVRDAVRAHTAIESAYAENPVADEPKS